MALRNGDVPGVGLGDPSIGVEGRRFAWRLRMTVEGSMALRNGDVPGVGLGDPLIGVEGRRFAWRLRMTVGGGGSSVTARAPASGTIGPVLSARGVTNGKGPAPALWNARARASGRQPAIRGRTGQCRCTRKGRALLGDAVA